MKENIVFLMSIWLIKDKLDYQLKNSKQENESSTDNLVFQLKINVIK